MSEAALPLFPEAAPRARRGAVLGCHGEVEYLDLPVREVLSRSRGSRRAAQWALNPYRGCEFACSFCFARSTHGYFGLDPAAFDNRIFVKREARAAFERRLKRASLRGESIAIGTVTDPYQPAERRYGVTRSLLEALLRAEGLDLSITTRSPLVLRDRELLAALDRRHAVTVHMTLVTVDPELSRRLEPRAPDPRARLRAVAGLAADGVATSIYCMPILPAITDGAAVLEPLMAAARRSGAFDVVGCPLLLRPAARAGFWPWLRAEYPRLVPTYRKLYGRRGHLRPRRQDEVMAEFRRLRLRHGFPADRPGRA